VWNNTTIMLSAFSNTELQVISNQIDNTNHVLKGAELCNSLFGFSNWSSEIRELRLYFTNEVMADEGKVSYSSGASAICRILLRDGSHRDAVGVGECLNSDTKMKSFEGAQQAAISDGLQKCIQQFIAGRSHSTHPLLSLPSAQETSTNLPHDGSSGSVSGVKRPLDQESNNLYGESRTRQLPQETPVSTVKHFSHGSTSHKTSATPNASPSLEDIDSLMQQYDQVKDTSSSGHSMAQTTTSCTTPAPPVANTMNPSIPNTSNSTKMNDSSLPQHILGHPGLAASSSGHSLSAGSGMATVAEHSRHSTQTSLKGQRYPSQPNLPDPFGRKSTEKNR